MKFVALISGGKDSIFNIHHCLSQGHELVAIGNLYPKEINTDEIDSFMFQTVGHDLIDNYRELLDVPLYREAISGSSSNTDLEYSITKDDEIEDLFNLLSKIITEHPQIEGVSCGAILSHYQRTRVENVCERLGLTSMTYLWQRNQLELMNEMCNNNLDARIIKVAAIGLNEKHLGKSISEVFPVLIRLNQLYDVHICGEGGEFETVVFDSPVFPNKKLKLITQEVINHSNDDVCYLRYDVELVDKTREKLTLIEPPPLLLEDFNSIFESIDFDKSETKYNGKVEDINSSELKFKIKPTITETSTKLYISNLVSQDTNINTTVAQQTTEIFDQLSQILKSKSISFDKIQNVNLLLSDINLFSSVNEIYQIKFNSFYLPPSRFCIETTLPNNYKIQLSCIVTLPSNNVITKQGIHIRSRSYWAPQNIGPYSQSIIDVTNNYKLGNLSGQIPLIPSTMELCEDSRQFVLSLQHLYRVKTLINVNKIAYVVCFVKDRSLVSMVNKIWNSYCLEIEISEWQSRLIICQIGNLPKNANIEWSGLSYETLIGMYDEDDEEGNVEAKVCDFSLLQEFEELTKVEIGKREGGITIHTLFTNSISKAQRLIDILQIDWHLQIFTSLEAITKLNLDNNSIELLPTLSNWSASGEEFEYGFVLKIEH